MPPTQPNSNTEEEQPPQRHPSLSGPLVNGEGSVSQLLEVYDPDFLHVVFVPIEKVVHTPPKSMGVTRLVLCRNYDEENADACIKGPACKFVHANVEGCRKQPIHVNYAWRSMEAVTYPRLPPGETLSVLAPNERPPVDEVPSERILVTRGSASRRDGNRTLSHCAHYYFNRMCNRGERCNFVHAVHIQPNATAWQRAPAPTAVAPLHRPPKGQQAATPPEGDRQTTTNSAGGATTPQQSSNGTPNGATTASFVDPAAQQPAPMTVVAGEPQPVPLDALQQGPQESSLAMHHVLVPSQQVQGSQVATNMPMLMLMPQMPPAPGFMPAPVYHHQQQHQQQSQQPPPQIVYQPIYVPVMTAHHQPQQIPAHHFLPQPVMQTYPPVAPYNHHHQPVPSMTSFYYVPPSGLQQSLPQQQQMPQVQVGAVAAGDLSGRGGIMNWSHHGNVYNASTSTMSTVSTASSNWKR
jgi:hypothetical protein